MRNKQLKIGAIISYLTIVFNIITGLIYTPWVLRAIGDDDYSIYTVATSLIAIFMMDFGISSSISKFVSKYIAENRQEEIDNFMGVVYKLYLIIDTIVFVVLAIVFFNIANIYSGYTLDMLHKMRIVFLIIGSYSLLQFPFMSLTGVIASHEKFIFNKCLDLFQKIAIAATMILIIQFGGGLYGLVLTNAAYGLIVVALRFFYCTSILRIRPRFLYNDRELIKQIFSYSIWMTIISLTNRVYYTLAPTIVARYSISTDVNIFGFASAIESYSWTIGTAIFGMFMTKMTVLSVGENSDENMLFLMIRNGRFQILILGLIFVGWVSIGKEFVNTLWLGDKYEAVYFYTIVLLLPDLFDLPQQLGETILIVKEKISLKAISCVISAIIYAVIVIPFVRFFGVIGVCYAIALAFFLRMTIMDWFYARKASLRIGKFFKEVYFKIVPFQALVVVIALILNATIADRSIGNIVFRGVLIVTIYITVMMLFCVTKQEKALVMSMIKRG